MKRTTARTDTTGLGRIMTVWAHPDDESYLSAGLMAMARSMGQPVSCVVATRGDHADNEAARAHIGVTRTNELVNALRILGVDDVTVLGVRDGECRQFDDQLAIAMIRGAILERRPDTVVTFGPDGFTGHADHRAVSRWVSGAVASAALPVRVLHAVTTAARANEARDIDARYGVFEPGLPAPFDPHDLALCIPLCGELLDRKVQALRAHHSQTATIIDGLGEARYRRWISCEMFVDASRTTRP